MTYLKISLTAALLMAGAVLSPVAAQSDAEVAVRVTQIENQIRLLVGQVEQLTYEVKQLRSQRSDSLGEAPSATPPALPKKPDSQAAALPEDGIEQIEDPPASDEISTGPLVTTIVKEDGSEERIVLDKAPGPTILGTMSSRAAKPGDGGFQGKVLVSPSQQDGQIEQGTLSSDADAVETAALAPESPEALYERSNESLLRRQFGEAEAGFRNFIQKYPDHSLSGSAQYWLGETYYAQSDFRQAAQAFLRGYQQYPKSRRAADSLLKLGISLGRLGQKQQACAAYGSVGSEYPKAVEARKRAQSEAKRAGCET